MVLETPEERAQVFCKTRKTLHLATVGIDGTPTASYAPFIHSDALYIYISALSRHTKDLHDTKKASVLLIEDETSAENLFARKRITFSCNVGVVERETSLWYYILSRFETTFGSVFGHIRPLPDFTLFRLKPCDAIYVEGFGQAYRMNPELTSAIHIKRTGPGAHGA